MTGEISAPTIPTRLAVGITVFKPDRALLEMLVDTFRPSGHLVFAHIDGPVGMAIEADVLTALRAKPWLRLIETPENGGIGAAMNRLAAVAMEAGASHLLLFDQDSSPMPDLPNRLREAFAALAKTGERAAVVGARPVVPRGETGQPPRYRRRGRDVEGCEAVDYVITSGSLIDLAAFQGCGPFRADYFIDGIDVEWCLRAWARGYSVWCVPGVALPHRIGNGVIRLGPLRFPDQSPLRMAFYVRNQTEMLRLAHVPVRWKARSLVYLPVQVAAYALARRSPAFVGLMLRAAANGWLRRLGSSPGSKRDG